MRDARAVLVVLSALLATGLAACGGGERQDADQVEGTRKVDVISASFPGKQYLADTTELQLKIKNVDDEAVPNLAVTVDGFDQRRESEGLAEPRRPVWVVENGPVNSDTAFTNTWSLGEVPAGQTRTLKWTVTAVRAGTYTLRWRVAGGLHGKSKVELPNGDPVSGQFVAQVSDKSRPF
jgi:hypothetical protein